MERSVYQEIHELQKSGWWFGNSRNKLVLSTLKRTVSNLHSSKLLDIGCSEGAFLDYLNDHNVDFNAIDIDENAISFCHERGYSDRVKHGNIFSIPFEDETFDIVTMLDVVEHVEDDGKAMKEAMRVCRKDGLLLFILPAYQWLWSSNDVAYHHKKRYSKKMVLDLISRSGLKIESISFFNMLLFPVFVIATFYKKVFPDHTRTNVMKKTPGALNWMLGKVMDVENWLITTAGIYLPFGSSIIVAVKKEQG